MKKIVISILSIITFAILICSLAGCNEQKDFKVTFDVDGGVRVGGGQLVQEVESAKQIFIPIVEKEGYTFVEWDKTISQIKEDTIVKAIWEKNKFTVTFSVSDGVYNPTSGARVQTVKSASEIVLPIYTKDGYTLSWDTDISKITQSCTVKGIWTANKYKLHFVNSDGSKLSGIEDIEVEFGKSILNYPILQNGDKKFVGWQFSDGMPLNKGQVWEYLEDMTVKAVWTDYASYLINVDVDGGKVMNIPTTYKENSGAIINEATRTGYHFLGWIETDREGNPISQNAVGTVIIGKQDKGDKYYKATWKVKSYSIYFTSVSGTVSEEIMIFTYGQEITELPTVTGNDGYFECWKYGDKEIKLGDTWTIDDTGIEVQANFIRKFVFNLTLSRVVNNKTIGVTLPTGTPTTIEVLESEMIILPLATAQDAEEYTFFCWKYKEDDGNWVKLASNNVINLQTFPNNDFGDKLTIEIELVAFCSNNWSGWF